MICKEYIFLPVVLHATSFQTWVTCSWLRKLSMIGRFYHPPQRLLIVSLAVYTAALFIVLRSLLFTSRCNFPLSLERSTSLSERRREKKDPKVIF